MLNELATALHKTAHDKEFWINLSRPCCERRHGADARCDHVAGSPLAVLMLVVSELGEAAEAFRKNDRANFAEEIADTIIRLLDLACGYGIDLDAEVAKKAAFNAHRPIRHDKEC